MEDPVYRIGTGSEPNSCYDLLERVLRHMNLHVDPQTKKLFDNSTEYYTSYSRKRIQRIVDVASITLKPDGPKYDEVQTRMFNVDFQHNPDAPNLVYENTRRFPHQQALLNLMDQRDWETEP